MDGPSGPFGEVKPGVILLASRAGATILPLYLDCRPRWVASSWDRFQIPLPFSRIDGHYGDALVVPPDLSEDEVESLRRHLEKRMAEAYQVMDGAREAS